MKGSISIVALLMSGMAHAGTLQTSPGTLSEGAPIFGKVEDLSAYGRLNPHFAKAVAFARRKDLLDLPCGRYPIDGTNCWANIIETELRDMPERPRFEAHRDMIDLQLPLRCDELFGFTRTPEKLLPELAASPRDVVLWNDRGETRVIRPGEFAIFLPPYGAHAPCYKATGDGSQRKLVIKIRKSVLPFGRRQNTENTPCRGESKTGML